MPPLGIGRFRVRKNDRLIVRSLNSVAALLSVRIRVLYDDGDDDDLFINPLVGTADRIVQTLEGVNRAKKNGWIVGGEATVSVVATKRGQFYLDISTTDGSTVTPMCKGYVYDGHSLTPGEFIEPGPGGGNGNVRDDITTADPAAGAEIAAQTVPTNAIWLLRGYQTNVLVGAAAFTPQLLFRDGADGVRFRIPTGTLTATVTENLSFQLGAGEVFDDTVNQIMIPLPEVYMPEGWDIITSGITADDDYEAARLTVEEWLAF